MLAYFGPSYGPEWGYDLIGICFEVKGNVVVILLAQSGENVLLRTETGNLQSRLSWFRYVLA